MSFLWKLHQDVLKCPQISPNIKHLHISLFRVITHLFLIKTDSLIQNVKKIDLHVCFIHIYDSMFL